MPSIDWGLTMQHYSPPRYDIHFVGKSIRLGPSAEIGEQIGSSDDSPRLALIVGCSRSGTTWLYRMLRRLPNVHGVGEAGLGRLLRRLSPGAYMVVRLRGQRGTYVDKTPANVYDLEGLANIGAARAVHLVRDPRAVVASMVDAAGAWASARPGFDVETAATLWTRAVDEASRARRWWGSRIVTLRYEDLLEDTPTQLAVASRALRIETSIRQVRRAARCEQFPVMSRSRRTGIGAFFRHGRASGWERDLSSEQIAAIEACVGSRLGRFGYRSYMTPPA